MKDIIEMSLENMKKAKDYGFLDYEAALATAKNTLRSMLDVEPEMNQDIHKMMEYINKDYPD